MKTIAFFSSRAAVLCVSFSLCGGCLFENKNPQKLDLGVDPSPDPLASSAAYRGTIGAYTYYEGLRAMRVRGYGLVVGLGTNGSSDCPRRIYDRLVQRLYKRHRFSSSIVGVEGTTPEEMIRDVDTAVVAVEAQIPPAAVKGTRFDVAVRALPGTQTKSLRGGRLFATDLEVFRAVSPRATITGQVLAHAAGPLFSNPFSEGDAATQTTPREGIVVGGGIATKDRRIRLVLREPSYQRSQQIQDRINAFFPGPQKTADAISPSFVRLRVPEGYQDDTAHFLALVRALYLSRDPVFQAAKALSLADEMVSPSAPHALIALALEGVGRSALPVLDRLYTDAKDYVSFHAGAVGMRLGDHVASDTLIVHANDPACEYRFQAIRALARAEGVAGAAMALRRLLNDEDPRVQIAAYEGLVLRGDLMIQSKRVGRDNFTLDYAPTQRPNLIYVKRSGSRRIALFGRELQCSSPVLYRAPDGSVIITAHPGDETLTVLRVVVSTGSMSPSVPAPFAVGGLVHLLGSEAADLPTGEVTGLGLDYAAIARALYHLCTDGAINAEFILEQPNAAELFGPSRKEGRSESEL